MSRKDEIANIARNFPDRISMIRDQEKAVSAAASTAKKRAETTFFHANVVPPRFRNLAIKTKARPAREKKIAVAKTTWKNRDKPKQQVLFAGETIAGVETKPIQMRVCSIDDVVKWATELPPENLELEFGADELGETTPACDTRYGACE